MYPYKRILSLDGGGAWALIQARALAKLYPGLRGLEILRKYDLVLANSGGALVLGGLLGDGAPDQIADQFFLNQQARDAIFVKTWYGGLTRWLGFGPRYSTSAKLDGIRQTFNEVSPTLADCPLNQIRPRLDPDCPDVIFTTFDYDKQRAVYLRSNSNSLASSNPVPASQATSPTVAEAIHASSTAPVNYFNEPARFSSAGFQSRRFWDGAVAGLNNPVLAGVIEALANGSDARELVAVSIGTASVVLPLANGSDAVPPLAMEPPQSGLVTDLKLLARAIVDDPPDAASYMAYRILHGPAAPLEQPRVIRFNPLIQPLRGPGAGAPSWNFPPTLDAPFPDPDSDETRFEHLVKLEIDATAQEDVVLIDQFCSLWMAGNVHNQPIQAGDDLSCHIGHQSFGAAQMALGRAVP
jgi:hypothetical protein